MWGVRVVVRLFYIPTLSVFFPLCKTRYLLTLLFNHLTCIIWLEWQKRRDSKSEIQWKQRAQCTQIQFHLAVVFFKFQFTISPPSFSLFSVDTPQSISHNQFSLILHFSMQCNTIKRQFRLIFRPINQSLRNSFANRPGLLILICQIIYWLWTLSKVWYTKSGN